MNYRVRKLLSRALNNLLTFVVCYSAAARAAERDVLAAETEPVVLAVLELVAEAEQQQVVLPGRVVRAQRPVDGLRGPGAAVEDLGGEPPGWGEVGEELGVETPELNEGAQ